MAVGSCDRHDDFRDDLQAVWGTDEDGTCEQLRLAGVYLLGGGNHVLTISTEGTRLLRANQEIQS